MKEGLTLFIELIIATGYSLLMVWLAAKIIIGEIKKEIFTYNTETKQWTEKEQKQAEWERWKNEREYEEFEQWKRKKEEHNKA